MFRSPAPILTALALLAAGAGAAAAQGVTAAERRAIDRAERLREAGRPEEARAALIEQLERAPGSLTALTLLAELAAEAGDAADALPYAEAAATASEDAGRARRLWVAALLAAGLPDSARAVAERWRAASPDDPLARLALADALLAGADSSGAVAALAAPGGEGSVEIALRLADLLAARGADGELTGAWADLLSAEPPRIDAVVEYLTSAGPRRAELLGLLEDRLAGGPGRAAGAAAIVALRLGGEEEARRLVAGARTGDETDDAALLREYAREADEAGLAGEVAWAARELVGLAPRPVDRQRWRALAADRSLATGDTGSARRDFLELAGESRPGEAPHELATRRLFGLLAADPGALGRARDLLAEYARHYPDSTRARASMHGELALGHARAGDVAAGEVALAGARRSLPTSATGPLDAAGARLALFEGRRDLALVRAGRSALEEGLPAGERTARLELVTLAQSADSADFAIAGRAALALHADPGGFDPGGTARELAARPAGPGRPVTLAFVADRAEAAGRPEVASALRRRIVESFPASAEAPAALLDLARTAPPDEAAGWLERLVVTYPESALAPMARRLLSELGRG